MYCPKCGTENADDAEYCSKCGNRLKTETNGSSQYGNNDDTYKKIGTLIGLGIWIILFIACLITFINDYRTPLSNHELAVIGFGIVSLTGISGALKELSRINKKLK